MSIVNSSQFALRRARRELEKAFEQCDWEQVRHWDIELGQNLNAAFDDENRDTTALVSELENILCTYANLVESLPAGLEGHKGKLNN